MLDYVTGSIEIFIAIKKLDYVTDSFGFFFCNKKW